MRGCLDGIDSEEMNRLMTTRDRLRSGVFMDVYLQAKMQAKYADSRRTMKEDLRRTGFRKEFILGNLRRLTKIVAGLKWTRMKSEWSQYADNTSYTDADSERKAAFVRTAVSAAPRNIVWDIGCNTGRYSRIAAEHSKYVVDMDFDHLAVEQFYQELKSEHHRTILPLVVNVADASPGLGWRGLERKTLPDRGKPDITLCLALIHHVVISANIPMHEFLEWLASLETDLVIEFVSKEDPMVKILLKNKEDQYSEYTLDNFESIIKKLFSVVHREPLASGTRHLVHAQSSRRTRGT